MRALFLAVLLALPAAVFAGGAVHHNQTTIVNCPYGPPIAVTCDCSSDASATCDAAATLCRAASACASAADVQAIVHADRYRWHYVKCVLRHGLERCGKPYWKPIDP